MNQKRQKATNIVNTVAGAVMLIIGIIDIDWAWGLVALACGVGILVTGILGLLKKAIKVIGIIQIMFGSIDILVGLSCGADFDWTYISLLTGAALLVTGILRTLNKSRKATGIIEIVFGGILLLVGAADIQWDWGLCSLAGGASFLVSGILLLVMNKKQPGKEPTPDTRTGTEESETGKSEKEKKVAAGSLTQGEIKPDYDHLDNSSVSTEEEIHRKVMFFSGICGAVLLFIGCLLPMYGGNILGYQKNMSYIEGDGIIVVVLALLAAALMLYKKYRMVIVPMSVSTLLVIYDSIKIKSSGNAGAAFGFKIGFYLIIIALIALCVCVVEAFLKKWDRTGMKSNIIAGSMMGASVVLMVAAVLISGEITRANRYESALDTMKKGKYEKALNELKELGDYKDAGDKSKECTYLWAEKLLSEGRYDDARELYQGLKNYEDSETMLLKCDFEEIVNEYSQKFSPDRKEYIYKLAALKGYPEAEKQCGLIVADELKNCDNTDDAVSFLESIRGVVDVETELSEYRRKQEEEAAQNGNPEAVPADAGQDEPDDDANGSEEGGKSYILPGSDSVKLNRKDILALSLKERRLARNEIYARHGRKFSDPSLQEYFDGQDWYIPMFTPEEFDEGVLSKVEKYNLRMIKKYE